MWVRRLLTRKNEYRNSISVNVQDFLDIEAIVGVEDEEEPDDEDEDFCESYLPLIIAI
jgi:hypothetical protein